MQESDAHYAFELTGGKNREGKMGLLFEYAKSVWREGMDASELLSALPAEKAHWESLTGEIRWLDKKGQWKVTKDSTFVHSNLPGWKNLFRASLGK